MLRSLFQTNPPETAQPSSIFVLVGLGNPGREYRFTRHNTGFMVIDFLSESLGFKLSRMQSKAIIGSGVFESRKVILAKPQTFMNLSGQSVSGLVHFYKIPLSNLLIIHDDLDLPLGALRLRPGGGSAGQKGLASTIQHLGTQNFPRMRVGIGRPPGQMVAADYVLQDFSNADRQTLSLVLDRAEQAAKIFITGGLEKAMNQFNGNLPEE